MTSNGTRLPCLEVPSFDKPVPLWYLQSYRTPCRSPLKIKRAPPSRRAIDVALEKLAPEHTFTLGQLTSIHRLLRLLSSSASVTDVVYYRRWTRSERQKPREIWLSATALLKFIDQTRHSIISYSNLWCVINLVVVFARYIHLARDSRSFARKTGSRVVAPRGEHASLANETTRGWGWGVRHGYRGPANEICIARTTFVGRVVANFD